MKKIVLLTILLVVMTAISGISQTRVFPDVRQFTRFEYQIQGRGCPFFYTTICTLVTGSADTTNWMQISYTYTDTASQTAQLFNKVITRYNAKYFGVQGILTSGDSGDGTDSVAIDTAYFEYAWDTTAAPIWNGDRSNFFIIPGAADSTLYHGYVYEPIKEVTPAHGYDWKLAVQRGGYFRIIASAYADVADTTFMYLIIWGKE